MIFSTNGIVLRTLKYGDTSIIVSIYTETFGIQSYLVNGIRTTGKNSSGNAIFQPSSLLDLNVYHSDLKNLQRIKDYKWSFLYDHVLTDVTKNAVAMYMVELMQKSLKQPETNTDLFHFCEDAFIFLDKSNAAVTANFPLYFCIHLAYFFGFRMNDNYSEKNSILDLQEGVFANAAPSHGYILDGANSYAVSQILKAQKPGDLEEIKLNKLIRAEVLNYLQYYFAFHIQDFGVMKTLPVLQTLFS